MSQPTNNPLISVIIPVFNAAEFVYDSVQSIVNQSYDNLEILVCNDGSTDNSLEILNSIKDPRIRCNHNDCNQGYLPASNKLMKMVRGDFMAFHDADDLSETNRIETLLCEFSKDPDLAICGSYIKSIDKSDELIYERKYPVHHNEILSGMRSRFEFCGSSTMIKRDVLENIGLYREYFTRLPYEDYDWMYRIVEKYKSKNVPVYLYNYRQYHSVVKSNFLEPKHFLADRIVRFLARQRATNGKDYLDESNVRALDTQVDEWKLDFTKDSSMIYRERSRWLIASRKYLSSVLIASIAVIRNPHKFINYKHFIVCSLSILKRIMSRQHM